MLAVVMDAVLVAYLGGLIAAEKIVLEAKELLSSD
tara:strand:+ start:6398 stop:6502 length:105 start_codon:yes stop_codon:yes gene_type:complete